MIFKIFVMKLVSVHIFRFKSLKLFELFRCENRGLKVFRVFKWVLGDFPFISRFRDLHFWIPRNLISLDGVFQVLIY